MWQASRARARSRVGAGLGWAWRFQTAEMTREMEWAAAGNRAGGSWLASGLGAALRVALPPPSYVEHVSHGNRGIRDSVDST